MKKRVMIILLLLCVVLIPAGIAVSVWQSSHQLVVREFTCTTPKITGELRLVVLADLHDHVFGEENQELENMVLAQNPDLVLMDGDMLNGDSENPELPCRLIRSLSQNVPVFYALGNHELEYMERRDPDLPAKLEEAGAEVLDKEYVDLDIGDRNVRLGGMMDYAFGLNGYDDAGAVPDNVRRYLESFQDTDRLKIMMCHRPDSFIFGNAASYWDVDLVISGHDHGGQVVLPFLGGLYGGDQGWFPDYVHGMYQKDNIQLFITSGLGSDKQMVPRVNNRPEIAVLTVTGSRNK